MASPFPHLQGHRFVSLTTYRKSGEGVSTPVWFAEDSGRLYIVTQGSSGKAKRIRNSGKVRVAPCDQAGKVLGEAQDAQAVLLPESSYTSARARLAKKYGLFFQLFGLTWAIQRAQTVYLEISPA